MNQSGNSFWDRIPLPALIGIWLVAILVGAYLVVSAFFSAPAKPADPQVAGANTPTLIANAPAPTVDASVPTPVVIGPTIAPSSSEPTLPAPTTAPSGSQPTQPPPTQAPSGPQPTVPPLLDPGMEYGIQSNALDNTEYSLDLIKDRLLLGWVKQQLKWGVFASSGQMDWSGFDHVIDAASARDLRVLLSIVTAPQWTRSAEGIDGPPDDLNAYAQFVGAVVDRYKGKIHAIEVWNEQNIDAEWKTNPQAVSPERYIEMLRLTYQVVKSKDPNIMVISGALSPTGYFQGGCSAAGCDDQPYLQRMVALGFLQYADCVGVHANGINFPPDKRHDEGYNDPTAKFRGPFDNPHPSWSFRSTLEDYNRIVGGQKKLCVTEFGWASYEGISDTPKPGYEYGTDNTAQEQYDWIDQAFRLMRQWGFVKLAILFNLDFAQKSPEGAMDRAAPWSITDLNGAERLSFRAVRRFMKEVLGIP